LVGVNTKIELPLKGLYLNFKNYKVLQLIWLK